MFTIITVVKNADQTIERCILSVLNQSINRNLFQYIIIDGLSTDNTCNIIKKYEDNVDTIISEIDNGISDAFNKGISLSKNKYTLFLSADDYFSNKDVLKHISIKFKNSSDVVSFAVKKININNTCEITYPPSNPRFLRKDMVVNHPATFCLTSILKNYPFDNNYTLAMDYKLMLILYLNNYKFKFYNDIIVNVSTAGVSHVNYVRSRFECFDIQSELIGRVSACVYLINAILRHYVKHFLLKFRCYKLVSLYTFHLSANKKKNIL